jgi:hypothetical protein
VDFLFRALICAAFIMASSAHAQVSPTADALLKSGTRDDLNLDSGRYTVREGEGESQVIEPKNAPAKKPVTKKDKALKVTDNIPSRVPPDTARESKGEAPQYYQAQAQRINNELQNDEVEIELHSEDLRHNMLKLSVAPGYFYVNSSSESWFRNYYGGAPSLNLEAEAWVYPEYSVYAQLTASLGADVTATPQDSRKIGAEHTVYEYGMRWHKFFGVTRRAPSMIIGLSINEYQMRTGTNEQDRIRLYTRGLQLELGVRRPVSNNIAWRFGTKFMPELKTKETSRAMAVSSGLKNSAQSLSVYLGREFIFTRAQQFYWQIMYRHDKHLYSGAATGVDPVYGQALSGISVNTGMTMFQIGFSWGD